MYNPYKVSFAQPSKGPKRVIYRPGKHAAISKERVAEKITYHSNGTHTVHQDPTLYKKHNHLKEMLK